MNPVTYFLSLISIFFFLSCSSTRQPQTTLPPEDEMEHVTMDTMSVYPDHNLSTDPPTYPYRPARSRTWDLLHTALDLSFVWDKQQVEGNAKIKLTPLFYEQTILPLDAVGFTIHRMRINQIEHKQYTNTGEQIIITLPRPYRKGEEVVVDIQYTASPSANAANSDAAIQSNQGLFFIDPLDTTPDLPRQIWTQGETSYNRRWFPTLDQPNERGTQEIILTVPDSMMTLSNGILVSSTPSGVGMRRDHWRLDLPHAPYLAMIAVGKWDKVTDYWRGKPVDYYVDPGYGKDARAIFAHTTEMLEYFSQILDYPFVWPKYSQIIVKEYVSGAMENTTAVVFGDFIQFKSEDVLIAGSNDYIVSHELFHHWFGDLVTCESWANLTLNEGFANYAEYLWTEHKFGREKADLARMTELSGYYNQAAYDPHDLIYYHYPDEMAVFDQHSYNKGGLVLHMLRDMVGDDAFFASLQHYLKKNQFSAVEVDDLRQSFEEITGEDLNWFFNQWYLDKGHPVMDIEHQYDASAQLLEVNFTQTQSRQEFRDVFRLPVDIGIFNSDSTWRIEKVWIDNVTQTYHFPLSSAPLAVVIDPRDILLAVVNHEVDSSEYAIRALFAPSVSHRLSALRLMEQVPESLLSKIVRDSSYVMRMIATEALSEKGDAARLVQMAEVETNPELRFVLLESLLNLSDPNAKRIAMKYLEDAKQVPLIYMGLTAIEAVDPDEALHQLAHFDTLEADALYAAKARILSKKENGLTMAYFQSPRAAAIQDTYLEELIAAFAQFLSSQPASVQDEGMQLVTSDFYLKTPQPQYRRFTILVGLLRQYHSDPDGAYKGRLLKAIQTLYAAETDDYLKSALKEGLGELVD